MSRKLQRVVGCLSRNSNVVGVGLAQSCAGNAYELRLRAELLDVGATDIAHSAAQTAYHLEKHVADRTLVWDAALYSFRYQFLGAHLAFLEVSIGAAVLHRGETAHAADHLESASLEQERFPRTFLRAGEHRAHHHARRTGRQRFHDITCILD